jgi:hypothetical protein
MPGPPDKWNKQQISTTSDDNAVTSNSVNSYLNTNAPFSGTVVAVCSDGTYLFIGWYA